MIKLDDLLQNYKTIKNPISEKKEVFDVLNARFGLKITEKNMFFRQNTVIFKVDSVQKNLIFMKKKEVLESINSVVPNRYIKKLQF